MNRWELTEKVKQKYLPIVQDFIDRIEDPNRSKDDKLLSKNFSGTELNPTTLCELLKCLDYNRTDQESNGWEWDFQIFCEKSGYKNLTVTGTGITFELFLCEDE